MQNVIVIMGCSNDACDISSKAGRMCLNQFCIEEDAAFEISGVLYLNKPYDDPNFEVIMKGMGNFRF